MKFTSLYPLMSKRAKSQRVVCFFEERQGVGDLRGRDLGNLVMHCPFDVDLSNEK